MGPSGCGKSSFLNTILGTADNYGNVTGEVSVNGEVVELSEFEDVVGFCPQDDIMEPDFTVRECLTFNAYFRLPSSCTRKEIDKKVETTIDLLQLSHIADSIIGNEKSSSRISGGQK